MTGAARTLAEFGIEWELRLSSAHRAPDRTIELARTAADRGFGAIIAGAGLAAHLPGVVASVTLMPVIGVPLSAGPMRGTDALHAIFAVADAEVRARLQTYVETLPAGVEAADARVQQQLAADPPGSPTPTTDPGG